MKEVSKYSLVFLSALILFPSSVSLAHVFAGHHHEFCNHFSESHFHKESTDCELFKFHKTPFPKVGIFSYRIFSPEIRTSILVSNYLFLSEFQELSFSLRGPPKLMQFRRKS